jgi:hypothetical protein
VAPPRVERGWQEVARPAGGGGEESAAATGGRRVQVPGRRAGVLTVTSCIKVRL